MNEQMQTYFGDVLANFQTGVQLDLRVKMALDLLKAGSFTSAEDALNCASALITLATERGLVKDLPEDYELTQSMKQHLRRSLKVQCFQQSEGPRIMAEETAHKLQPAATILPGPNGRSRG
jgi:hypothetical protein